MVSLRCPPLVIFSNIRPFCKPLRLYSSIAWLINVPHRATCWRLSPQPMALLGIGGTSSKWGPWKEVRSLRACPWRSYWNTGSFCFLFASHTMKQADNSTTCTYLSMLHCHGLKKKSHPIMNWNLWNCDPILDSW